MRIQMFKNINTNKMNINNPYSYPKNLPNYNSNCNTKMTSPMKQQNHQQQSKQRRVKSKNIITSIRWDDFLDFTQMNMPANEDIALYRMQMNITKNCKGNYLFIFMLCFALCSVIFLQKNMFLAIFPIGIYYYLFDKLKMMIKMNKKKKKHGFSYYSDDMQDNEIFDLLVSPFFFF